MTQTFTQIARTAAFTAAVASSLFIAAGASAKGVVINADGAPTITLDVHDIDFSTQAGVAAAQRRVKIATHEVCSAVTSPDWMEEIRLQRDCMRGTKARTDAQIAALTGKSDRELAVAPSTGPKGTR
jgi:UrcA family protein